jgi:hypothetical protein
MGIRTAWASLARTKSRRRDAAAAGLSVGRSEGRRTLTSEGAPSLFGPGGCAGTAFCHGSVACVTGSVVNSMSSWFGDVMGPAHKLSVAPSSL